MAFARATYTNLCHSDPSSSGARLVFADPASFRSPRTRLADAYREQAARSKEIEHDNENRWHDGGRQRLADDARDEQRAFGMDKMNVHDAWARYEDYRHAYRMDLARAAGQAPAREPPVWTSSGSRGTYSTAAVHRDGTQAVRAMAGTSRAVYAQEARLRSSAARRASADDEATDSGAEDAWAFFMLANSLAVAVETQLVAPAGARTRTPTVIPPSWPRPVTPPYMSVRMPTPVRPRDIPRAAVLEELAEALVL